MDDDSEIRQRSTNELAEERNDLAFERSKLAMDRTTMGFMRTSISLIGFGFSIPALFQVITNVPGLEESPVERARFVGVFMLVLAVFMLSTAIVQHVAYLRRLAKAAQTTFPFSVTLLSSCVLLVVALFALVNILSNMELV